MEREARTDFVVKPELLLCEVEVTDMRPVAERIDVEVSTNEKDGPAEAECSLVAEDTRFCDGVSIAE